MENANFDRKKVIEEMEALKAKRIDEIKRDIIGRNEIEVDEEGLNKAVIAKYLGKMEFVNEQGELVDKDVFILIEEHSGQFQVRYYDEDQKLLGIQRTLDEDIIPSGDMIGKLPEEMKESEGKDIEDAKTLDELKEEQKQEEQEKTEEVQEEQQLPGLEDEKKQEGSQLTKAQVNKMAGPKTRLNQVVNGRTLANTIGLTGMYIQLVDADTVRKMIPDAKIPVGQRNVPIEIYPDGTANVIGEDKLKCSSLEGRTSTKEHTTVTNDGKVQNEQNIETFNIVSTGGMETIAIGYDENYSGKNQQEIKYGVRDREDPTKIAYSELETVHNDPKQDSDAQEYRKEATKGINKGTDTIERAEEHQGCGDDLEAEDVDANKNNNNVHEEDAIRYARAKGLYMVDYYGNATGYDLQTAKEELEQLYSEGKDIDQIIEEVEEEEVKTLGPGENPRPH